MDKHIWSTVPKSVEKVVRHIKSNSVHKSALIQLTKWAKQHWTGNKLTNDEWETFCENSHISRTILADVYSGLLTTALAVGRLPEQKFVLPKLVSELQEIGFPSDVIQILLATTATDMKCYPRLPHLESTEWRMDIIISSSSVGRVLEPSILLELKTDSGSNKQIQLSLQQFHNLRCKVASALHDLQKIS